jgi:predicted TIM-barrel fold metal-dependent hydrolase
MPGALRFVDSHFHVWDLSSHPAPLYQWLHAPRIGGPLGDYRAICRDYLVADFLAEAGACGVVKGVHVEAALDRGDPLGETVWLQAVADSPGSRGFPHAIIAHVDLTAPDLDSRLDAHRAHRNFRGVRQIVTWDKASNLPQAPRDLLADPGWPAGLARLGRLGLVFDLQLAPSQMVQAAAIIRRVPETQIVLDHMGCPLDRSPAGMAVWREGVRALAACPGVAVKLSGYGMWHHEWTTADLRLFVLELIDVFGVERCLFGSNFPVDSLFSTYAVLIEAFDSILSGFSDGGRRQIMAGNSERVYRI